MKIGIRYPYHLEQRILLYLMPTVENRVEFSVCQNSTGTMSSGWITPSIQTSFRSRSLLDGSGAWGFRLRRFGGSTVEG